MTNFATRPQDVLNGKGIDPDQASDVSFFLGDTNFRFQSTYEKYIDNVKDAHKDIEKLDEF